MGVVIEGRRNVSVNELHNVGQAIESTISQLNSIKSRGANLIPLFADRDVFTQAEGNEASAQITALRQSIRDFAATY